MESKTIIIILVAVIVVLGCGMGAMIMQQNNAKEPSKIQITSNNSQYEGGEISLKLTDLNKTAIPKEIVNITVTDDEGKIVIDDVVRTDSNGKAKLNIDLEAGKYVVNASYGGNENLTGNSSTQNLTINEEVIETTPTTSTDNSQTDMSGGSGESVVVEDVDEETGVVEGYKGGRKGVWTPTGNFIAEGGS